MGSLAVTIPPGAPNVGGIGPLFGVLARRCRVRVAQARACDTGQRCVLSHRMPAVRTRPGVQSPASAFAPRSPQPHDRRYGFAVYALDGLFATLAGADPDAVFQR